MYVKQWPLVKLANVCGMVVAVSAERIPPWLNPIPIRGLVCLCHVRMDTYGEGESNGSVGTYQIR